VITGIPPTPDTIDSGTGLFGGSAATAEQDEQARYALDGLVYATKSDQLKLLNDVLLASEADLDDEDITILDDVSKLAASSQRSGSRAPKKVSGNMKSLSGADTMAYVEYKKQPTKPSSKSTREDRHKLFKKYRM
jgi:DNA excision repair protein ERCC-3